MGSDRRLRPGEDVGCGRLPAVGQPGEPTSLDVGLALAWALVVRLVLTIDHPQLAGALRALHHSGLRHLVLPGLRELQALAPRIRPSAIILGPDCGADEPSRAELDRLRCCLSRTPGMLLLALSARAAVAADLGPFDDVLSLRDPEGDLACSLAPRVPHARRAGVRRRCRIPAAFVPRGGEPIDGGVAIDVSRGGAQVLVPRSPIPASAGALVLRRDDGRSVEMATRVVWSRERAIGVTRLGLRRLDANGGTDAAIRDLAQWEELTREGRTVVAIHGDVVDRGALRGLAPALARAGVLDLSLADDITPAGFQGLLELLDDLSTSAAIELVHAPAWMVGPRTRRWRVRSAVVPATCAVCGLVTSIAGAVGASTQPRCAWCGGRLVRAHQRPAGLADTEPTWRTRIPA